MHCAALCYVPTCSKPLQVSHTPHVLYTPNATGHKLKVFPGRMVPFTPPPLILPFTPGLASSPGPHMTSLLCTRKVVAGASPSHEAAVLSDRNPTIMTAFALCHLLGTPSPG